MSAPVGIFIDPYQRGRGKNLFQIISYTQYKKKSPICKDIELVIPKNNAVNIIAIILKPIDL